MGILGAVAFFFFAHVLFAAPAPPGSWLATRTLRARGAAPTYSPYFFSRMTAARARAARNPKVASSIPRLDTPLRQTIFFFSCSVLLLHSNACAETNKRRHRDLNPGRPTDPRPDAPPDLRF
jgi:hypothetical protein